MPPKCPRVAPVTGWAPGEPRSRPNYDSGEKLGPREGSLGGGAFDAALKEGFGSLSGRGSQDSNLGPPVFGDLAFSAQEAASGPLRDTLRDSPRSR